MKLNLKIILGFGLLVSLFFTSCDSNRYFEQNIEITGEEWSANESMDFFVDIEDTNSQFNFYVNVRNTNEYPYANLYIFIESTFPDHIVARDTVELQLASLDGKWLGSGYGKYKYHHFILRKAMRFVQLGTYSFKIEHGMRKEQLQGISDIGIRLEYYP
ncbi:MULTISPECIES: gliding motility lipoprotein GldH [unclassified Lentimicrobium]|uniref:gliding motility lipoprotein GldH n=1 Tax=unclassified Lentimicrobium TaxID=2677434 RepID=UPI001551FF2F|nr:MULTISPECIES: gliding motility lipoprotein GldH [unclassified Lentimicrobium]NPD44910.1 gliding motility lipoprotein GldH [Lentimicrobium sp. S6]NPD83736.1 gliding motility lipoprotein GldH [Lentimicrobium sp. L6]